MAQRRATEWIGYTDEPGLSKELLRNNIFNLQMSRVSFDTERVQQGDVTPRVRKSVNTENINVMTFDSNDFFAWLEGRKGTTQTTVINFDRNYEVDTPGGSNATYTYFKAKTWELIDVVESAQAETNSPPTYTYTFEVTQWEKGFKTFKVWEVDTRPGQTPVIKRWDTTVNADGEVTAVSSDATDFASPTGGSPAFSF